MSVVYTFLAILAIGMTMGLVLSGFAWLVSKIMIPILEWTGGFENESLGFFVFMLCICTLASFFSAVVVVCVKYYVGA